MVEFSLGLGSEPMPAMPKADPRILKAVKASLDRRKITPKNHPKYEDLAADLASDLEGYTEFTGRDLYDQVILAFEALGWPQL